MYDLLIKNGTVIDGTGEARFTADVAITGEKIAAIEPHIPAEQARQVVDAQHACGARLCQERGVSNQVEGAHDVQLSRFDEAV